MKASRLACLVIGFLLNATWAQRPLVPTQATQACLDACPGLKAMAHGEELVALYGAPMARNDTTTAGAPTTDAFVTSFLFNPSPPCPNGCKEAFGVDGVDLVLKDNITIRNGKYTVYTYEQQVEGLPVHGIVF